MLMANATHNSNASSSGFRSKISPRNNQTLRQNGAKIVPDAGDSVKGQIKRVEDWIGLAQQTLREYKKEIEMLRQEIGLMENHLST